MPPDTHDPGGHPIVRSLDLEISNELYALRADFRGFASLMTERDRRYEERDVAAKDAVRAAMAAAALATDKTELALKEYKVSANEWRDTVKDLVARMPSRVEIEHQLTALEKEISGLRESRSVLLGRDDAQAVANVTQRWLIALSVSVLFSLVGVVLAVVFR
jgi:hypothetical protein